MTPDPRSQPLPVQGSVSPVAATADLAKTTATAVPNEAPQDGGSPSDDLPKGFDAAGDVVAVPHWMSLNVALIVLFASAGVNLFLGWVTVAQRGRYRSVLARLAVR
jgi:hypothetical protein